MRRATSPTSGICQGLSMQEGSRDTLLQGKKVCFGFPQKSHQGKKAVLSHFPERK